MEVIINNYNIGAGSFRHKDWVNVDNPSEWYSDVQDDFIGIDWDLLTLTPIPIDNETADLIYSSHCIEHVTDAAVLNMCREAYRILKVGGIMRLQVPDIDIFYNYFRKGKRIPWVDAKTPIMSKIPLKKASLPQAFVWTFASNATEIHKDGADRRLSDIIIEKAFIELPYYEALIYCVSHVDLKKQQLYPGNHMNWWNSDKLIDVLNVAGFMNAYVSSFGESKALELRDTTVFDKGHKKISFYVEVIK